MITVSYSVTKDSVLAMATHFYATSPVVRKNRLANQVGTTMVLAGCGLIMVCASDQLRPIGGGLLLCAVIAAVCTPAWHRLSLRKSAEKIIADTSYQKTFGRYTLALDETGLTSTSPMGDGHYVWAAVHRVVLTPDYLFIFLVGSQGFAISRSQVLESSIQEVKAFAESHVQSADPGAPPDGGSPAPSGIVSGKNGLPPAS